MEAFMHASSENLDNIIAIIDRNKLQIDGCTESIKSLDPFKRKIVGF